MLGNNCAIPGCSTSKATPGVALLCMPKTMTSTVWIGEKT